VFEVGCWALWVVAVLPAVLSVSFALGGRGNGNFWKFYFALRCFLNCQSVKSVISSECRVCRIDRVGSTLALSLGLVLVWLALPPPYRYCRRKF
jgi:hypothetical protein